ncbi:polysaccharide deacetylase family protein [Clostridium sp. DJ247]|uniref:polysaccharide deacetylase family protein n=1 Tax=Clostridium sp. DJ247 TaxID=2726188 RepID=UPI001626CAB9|nr:polysaccharide deacetylase family protein [Clostridium sp. DJ247]MBC2582319.1 polysaccharide deacetylase family protein [Clostridium sp. DJ247]
MSEMYWYILVFTLVYMVFPSLYYRYFSRKVLKHVSCTNNNISLTFDDGPDPRYTPKLLDLLKENNVKCTFFVLAKNAERYPELITRMYDEGHCIGLHSFKHTNPIFTLPYHTKKDFYKSIDIMNKLRIKVTLFRPPWGLFNILTFYYAAHNKLKVILWSIHVMDWSRWVSVDYIKLRLLSKVKPGHIILLHDGRGSKNAPEKTIKALEITLPELKQKGYNFILLKDILKEEL